MPTQRCRVDESKVDQTEERTRGLMGNLNTDPVLSFLLLYLNSEISTFTQITLCSFFWEPQRKLYFVVLAPN